MPRQLHRLLEGSTSGIEQGDVGMPQGVEVGEQRAVGPLDGIGDAGRLKVDPQHLGRVTVGPPRARPNGLLGGPAAKVGAQGLDHVRGQGLDGNAGILRAPCPQGDGGRVSV
jgi:hypothetical protein